MQSATPLASTDRSAAESSAAAPLTAGETELIGIFVQMTQTLGLPGSLGEIYGLLFASARPLAQQDIVERLQISKGSVSQGLRFLRTIGAIQACPNVNDRRECFEPVVELRALVGGFIRERITPQLEDWSTRTKKLSLAQFKNNGDAAPDTAELNLINNRLEKLKTWHQRAELVLPLMGKLIG